MAFIGAAAILVANGGANRRRGPNIHREGCISAKSDRMSVRLDRNEVTGLKLWCKTGFTPKFNTKPNSTFGLKLVLDAGIKVRCKT